MDGAVIYVYVEECVGVSVSAEQAGEKWERERERERERDLSEITSMTHGRLLVLFPVERQHHILCPLALWHPLSERASPTSPRRPTLSLSAHIHTFTFNKNSHCEICRVPGLCQNLRHWWHTLPPAAVHHLDGYLHLYPPHLLHSYDLHPDGPFLCFDAGWAI